MATAVYPAVSPTSGSPFTKGAYVQVTAATTFNSSRVWIWTGSTNAANLSMLLDLATGAAGSEVVVASNLPCVSDSDFLSGAMWTLDVDIPTGTRLAVRLASNGNLSNVTVQVAQDSRALGSLAAPVTYGAITGVSRGTAVDPGGTINTKGAYVQLTASTTARIDAALLTMFFDNTVTTAVPSFTNWHVDLATGAAGAEVVVLADLLVVANTLADNTKLGTIRLPISIPAGTRLAVRCDCNRNTSSDRSLRIAVVGMQEPATGAGGGTPTSVAYLG